MIKKLLVYGLLASVSWWSSAWADLVEKPMVVVIPSYNNKSCYEKNLESVFLQQYENYRVIFIDDASPDMTGPFAKSYIKLMGQKERVTFIQNPTRNGALANIYQAVWMCNPDEVIVTLDGDDWFYDDQVLNKLNEVYSDPDVWMTYGQFVFHPGGHPGWASQLPQEVIENNAFREYHWVTTHLRTFYAGLFQHIDREDLLVDGEFFSMAWDLGFMFPMLEMAGVHSRFISDYLYVYNAANPLSDIKVDPDYQMRLGWYIRTKEKYAPIASYSSPPLRDAASQ
jgi:glycosyltransferase involved in cell wall biosynthesis